MKDPELRRRLAAAGVALVLLVTGCQSSSSVSGATDVDRGDSVPAAANREPGVKLIAHRGLHQTFAGQDLTDETCSAEGIDPPVHDYLENTEDSISAGFEAGAAVVEIDIAPTADDVLVVFHDWTVDCRTEATGAIRDMLWAEVSALDIGYGYTTDGATFPFRGQGVGLMPTLEQILMAFPDGRFLVNFKSDDIAEARLLFELVERTQGQDQIWAVYGAHDTVAEYRSLANTRGFSEQTVKACLVDYVGAGSSEELPPSCRDTVVALPFDLAQMMPGGPAVLSDHLVAHGSDLILSGPNFSGIDTAQAMQAVPKQLEVFVWTNRMDLVGGDS